MKHVLDLAEVKRRTVRDTVMDGLVEIMMGLCFFFISGMLYREGKAVSFALLPMIIFIIILSMQYLKNRFVFPRIGYVKLAADDNSWRNMIVIPYFLIAGLVVLAAILFFTGDYRYPVRWYFWMPVFISIFLSGLFIGIAVSTGLRRYYLYLVINIFSAALAMILPFEGKLGVLSNYLLILSGFLIITGIFVFIFFIRKNPVQPTEVEAYNEKN